MKNWLPLVLGPALAMDSTPRSWLDAIAGLVLEAVARAAAAGALRATALDHEIRDHAVEIQAVVEAALGQVDEVGDGQRRLVGGTARRWIGPRSVSKVAIRDMWAAPATMRSIRRAPQPAV